MENQISTGKLKVNDVPQKTIFTGFDARIIHTENSTIAFVDIAPNSELPAHEHHNEQSLRLIEGEMDVILGDEVISMKSGDMLIIPPNVTHSGYAKTACKVQDIFVPRRDDWIENN